MKPNSIKIICVVLAFVAISSFFHFYFEKEGDGDIFYHFKHAEIYAERGIFYEFDWLPQTIVGEYGGDMWYGFHLLLIPFTYFEDPADESGAGRFFGLKLAGVFVTTTLLVIFYLTLRLLKTRKEFLWTLFMFFSTPHVLYHLLLIRPHVLSTALAAIMYPLLVSNNYFGIFFVSFLMAWIHLSLIWVAILILFIFTAVGYLAERRISLKPGVISAAGMILGIILRPNPLGSLKQSYEVIVGIPLARLQHVSLNWGKELYPLTLEETLPIIFFGIVWLGLAVLIYIKRKEVSKFDKKDLIALFPAILLSIIFFVMSYVVANRSMDLWIVFGTIFSALAFNYFLKPLSRDALVAMNTMFFLFVALLVFRGFIVQAKNINANGWDVQAFRGAALWLRDNSKQGELIINVSWDSSPFLVFWNSKNKYIGGMDPILQYAHDKELYLHTDQLRIGNAIYAKNIFEKTNARYIFLTKANEMNLYGQLIGNDKFAPAYEDADSAIFEIK